MEEFVSDGLQVLDGLVDIRADATVTARMIEGVILRPGVRARLEGEIRGPITVEQGAYLRTSAMIQLATVRNHGHIKFSGHVSARIEENHGLIEFAVGTLITQGRETRQLMWDGSLGDVPSSGVMFIDDEFTEWFTYDNGAFVRRA